jgi:hypothetical protein
MVKIKTVPISNSAGKPKQNHLPGWDKIIKSSFKTDVEANPAANRQSKSQDTISILRLAPRYRMIVVLML